MRFWDSSAVVQLLIEQPTSSEILKLYRQDPVMLVWWTVIVECTSALARLERDKDIANNAMLQALTRLRALRSNWQEIQPVEAVRELAVRLLRVHNLRTGDSLHLAAAIIASEHSPSSLDFVCLDGRLCLAAQREGFNVIPTN